MEGVIRWFSRNHVPANFLMLTVMLMGFVSWFQMRKEIFPSVALDRVLVQVPYPNATPEEAAQGICVPVEEAVADIEGIKKVESTAAQSIGTVSLEIENGYDVREVMSDVKTRVDAIDIFPENAEKPIVEEMLFKFPVMSIAIVADTDEESLRKLSEEVRDELLHFEQKPSGITGMITNALHGATSISWVEISGVRPYEISLEVREESLRELGLTIGDVAQAVRRTSLDLPAGSVRTKGGEVILRALAKQYRAEDLAQVTVASKADGSQVRLGDIADLVDGFEDLDLSSRYDGKDAVSINVFRVGEEDTTALAKLVKSYVAQKNEQVPDGVRLEIWNNESVFLEGRLDLLARNATLGLGLVLLVLTMFLRPSLAVLVALGIPASFAGGILMMPILGVSINMISLFAFILVLGIVVDDSIVTAENVYTRIQHGEHPVSASWRGTHEVGTVVVFGVLTTMVAFTPMLGLSGVNGKIWPNIPLVVIPTLFFSLLQSKFVLPAHLAILSPTNRERKVNALLRLQRRVANGLEWFVKHVYQPFLEFCLHWRYLVVAIFLSILVFTIGVVMTGHIKYRFFPDVEGDVLSAKFEMTQGVPFLETQKVADRIAASAKELGEQYQGRNGESVLLHMLASAGTQPFQTGMGNDGPSRATHLGEVTLELIPAATRDHGSEFLVEKWRGLMGDIPGLVTLAVQAETASGGDAIELNLVGSNTDTLLQATEFLKEGLAKYSGVIDISDSNRAGKDEIRFLGLTEAGKSLGFRLDMVAQQVRDAFYGNEVHRLQRGRDEVKVMVRFPRKDRKEIQSLETMKLRSPSGGRVPLRQIVNYEFGNGPAVVTRTDRQRSIKVTADVDTKTNANEVVSRFTKEVLTEIPTRFPGVRYAFEGEQRDQNESVREIINKFLFALLIMYVLIAVPLKSYSQPLIVMSVIPFGLVGAIWGHALLGFDLSIMSMCGFVALSGVVVNDSLVMVDYVNRNLEKTGSVMQAAHAAGGRRFRAILLTSLTTFAGLMPMLFETDMQARFLIPMAVALGFGILFATAITLILVPSIYIILNDLKNLTKLTNSPPPVTIDSARPLKSREPSSILLDR